MYAIGSAIVWLTPRRCDTRSANTPLEIAPGPVMPSAVAGDDPELVDVTPQRPERLVLDEMPGGPLGSPRPWRTALAMARLTCPCMEWSSMTDAA
jgi:hypothetical protein